MARNQRAGPIIALAAISAGILSSDTLPSASPDKDIREWARLHTQPWLYRHVQGRANALHTLWRLAQVGVSILVQDQTAGGWGRPNWRAQVVGLGQALLFVPRIAQRERNSDILIAYHNYLLPIVWSDEHDKVVGVTVKPTREVVMGSF